MEIFSYKDLIVWQKSMDLVVMVYRITESYPQHELFGLTGQTRKSAISIPSNIAEGRGRGTRKDFNYFLKVALGSASELETQLEIAKRLQYLKKSAEIENLLLEIIKMLKTMTGKLNK